MAPNRLLTSPKSRDILGDSNANRSVLVPDRLFACPLRHAYRSERQVEVQNINLRKGEQNLPDYLKLNPKHKVPLLLVDGQSLTENVAIQIWIARNFPQAKLLPADPWQELKAISIMSW